MEPVSGSKTSNASSKATRTGGLRKSPPNGSTKWPLKDWQYNYNNSQSSYYTTEYGTSTSYSGTSYNP